MRAFFLTSLAVAGLAAAASSAPFAPRKSLGFGPVHPHASFTTKPLAPSTSFGADADPFAVARETLVRLAPREGDWVIRDDSYTDKLTGVTHVYVRQLVNGIEVADGDINMNIKDGVVLSHGDSFYRGPTPAPHEDPAADLAPHDQYCEQLFTATTNLYQQPGLQLPIGEMPHGHLISSNCESAPDKLAHPRYAGGSPSAKALMRFMLAATPNENVAGSILDNYDAHVDSISSVFEHHLVGGHQVNVEMLHNVPDTVNPVKARMAYVQVPKGDSTVLSLVWKFEVEMRDNWYEAAVSVSEPHRTVAVVDWAADAAWKPKAPKEGVIPSYNIFPWGVNDPSDGDRAILQETPDRLASPAGWHSLPAELDPSLVGKSFAKGTWHNTTTTWGNNVFAHENWEGRNDWENNYRPEAGEDMVFDYKYNPKEKDTPEALEEAKKYINTTITQLFVTSNLVHDLFYRYGFDEVSGNFQQHNFGRGGREDDAVIANAQDGSGYNNANFMTPPDGQKGRCRMYLWNTANPYRDGDLEAGIVIHELAHGLSTRLTGGPANSGCLGWGESGGMGEGWGDFLATTIRSTAKYHDYPMGAWAANRERGIRNFPYSLNETVNPSTYKTLDKPGYFGVHAIGEVWAEILWIVSQKLIAEHGYSDTLFPPGPDEEGVIPANDFYIEGTNAPKHGNTLSVALVISGMKLQPCRPSFFDARDAIIQADQVLTGGKNFCTLWSGFAQRGLGPDARVDGRTPWGGGIRTNDYAVPAPCKEEKTPETPGDEE